MVQSGSLGHQTTRQTRALEEGTEADARGACNKQTNMDFTYFVVFLIKKTTSNILIGKTQMQEINCRAINEVSDWILCIDCHEFSPSEQTFEL